MFIVYGLNKEPLEMPAGKVTAVLVLTQVLLISSFSCFNPTAFGSCSFQIDAFYTHSAPTTYHIMVFAIIAILCSIVTQLKWPCCRKCCDRGAICVFLLSLIMFSTIIINCLTINNLNINHANLLLFFSSKIGKAKK